MLRNGVFFSSPWYTFPLTYGHGQLPILVVMAVVIVQLSFLGFYWLSE